MSFQRVVLLSKFKFLYQVLRKSMIVGRLATFKALVLSRDLNDSVVYVLSAK